MLRDVSLLVSPVLALLLVLLTPVGTGEGRHRDQLLDPLFPHVHLGGPLAPGLTSMVPSRPSGVAIEAGAGAASMALGAGITPPVPRSAPILVRVDVGWRFAL